MNDKFKQAINLKSITLLWLSIWIGLAFFAVLSQGSNYLTHHHFEWSILHHLRYYTLRIWLPWVVLTPIVLILAWKFPVKPKKWLSALLLHSMFLLLLSLLAGLIISLHYHFFEDMAPNMKSYLPWQHTGHFLFGDNIFLFNAIIYTVLVANLNIKHFSQMAHQEALIASRLKSQLFESQLQALRMQINPHFLFNTLNIISVLVLKSEQRKANEMISRLSRFLRQGLDEKDQQWSSLQQELTSIDDYLAIEQVRFGERLCIHRDVDDSILHEQVPTMILQPLIENAIQHGFGEKIETGNLTIRCHQENEFFTIDIIDDGVGCDFYNKNFTAGIGLTNVRSRLTQIYQRLSTLTFDNNEHGGVTVKIKLPKNSLGKAYLT